jgi:pyruvate kinase
MKLILTVPAQARFADVAGHVSVEGVRINTTLPVQRPLDELLADIMRQAGSRDVWIDLKCRQLRITKYNVEILHDREYHYLTLSHGIKVGTPAKVWLDDGNFEGNVVEVIGGRVLKVESSTEMRRGLPLPNQGEIGVRPSMSVNIISPALEIEGNLTDTDKKYIEAAKKNSMHGYMLSYVEQESDITDVLALDPDAKILAKIESPKGLEFVKKIYPNYRKQVNLVAARGDLYVELQKPGYMPDQIIDACDSIIRADPEAVIASRIFESLKDVSKPPACQDLFDVYCGMLMGYQRFLIGDEISTKRDSVQSTLGLFKVIAEKYETLNQKKKKWGIFGGK